MGTAVSRCVESGPFFLLKRAIRRGDLEAVRLRLGLNKELLLYHGIKHGNTVWHVAAGRGDVQVLSLLLELGTSSSSGRNEAEGGDVGREGGGGGGVAPTGFPLEDIRRRALNSVNHKGQTPLVHAVIAGHADAVRWLLAQGADPWVADRCGKRTALHYAAMRGRLGCIAELMAGLEGPGEHERYLEAATISGWTPLHFAASRNQGPAVAFLLQHGANILAVNRVGDAYDYVDLPAGSTPLHAAAFFGHLDAAVEILRHYDYELSGTATPDPRLRRDAIGRTPHQVAVCRRHYALADLLHTGGDLRAMFGRDSDDSLLQEQLVMGVAANTHAAAGSVAWQQQQEDDQQQLQHASSAPMAGAGQEGAVGFGMGMRAGRRVVGVPRLAKIAEVAVRRRMMDDIDLAEKAIDQYHLMKQHKGSDASYDRDTATSLQHHHTRSHHQIPGHRDAAEAAEAATSAAAAQQGPLLPPSFLPPCFSTEPSYHTTHAGHATLPHSCTAAASTVPPPALPIPPASSCPLLPSPPGHLPVPTPSTSLAPPCPPPITTTTITNPPSFNRRSSGACSNHHHHNTNTNNKNIGNTNNPFARDSLASTTPTAYVMAPVAPLAQCCVCLDDDAPCLVLEPCRHRLCAGCCRLVLRRAAAMPMPCPVCREGVRTVGSPYEC